MKTTALKVLSALVIIILGVGAGSFSYGALHNRSLENVPSYPKNESGLTYGSAMDATSPETEPDLIYASGTNGKLGYVYARDLAEDKPASPKEAASRPKGKSRRVDLYQSDGKTVIGTFVIEAGESFSSSKSLQVEAP